MSDGLVVGKRSTELQPISHWLLRLFLTYIRYYLPRHFRALHLLNTANARGLEDWPLLVCTNHPSWWDPLFALLLSQYFFPGRQHYGPIASEGLDKYQFFEKLGFFGIDPKTRAGAAHFLQVGRTVLSRKDSAFWVSAQGRFTDVRLRPIELQPGIAHLAHSASRFVMLPLVFEFSFWVDRKPEAFACFGEPIFVENGREASTAGWLQTFTRSLETTQDFLSGHVKHRTPDIFESLFQSRSGVGGVYDLWQAFKSLRSETRRRLS